MLTTEQLNKRLELRHIQVISEYSTVQEKATFKCLYCNHQWNKKVAKILYDEYGCPKCCSKVIVNNPSKLGEMNERLKKLGLSLNEEYKGTNEIYTLTCLKNKNHSPIKKKLSYMFRESKERLDYVPCPECRVDARIQFLESQCPNLKIIKFNRAMTATSKYYKIKWQCKHCGHEFNRTDDEVLRGGYETSNDCPKCGYHRRKRFYNKVFDSFEAYREQLNKDTDWVNNNYTKFLNSDLSHIDHKCSAIDCYTYCIPVWMCCSPVNLRLIPATENLVKNRNSSITVSELVLEFSKWLLKHPEYAKFINKEVT